MAKKKTAAQKDNFKRHGWIVDDKYMKDYTLVTDSNRKAAIVIGRVLYIFYPDRGKFKYGGFMEIYPRLKKTMVKVSNHPVLVTHEFYSSSEMSMEEYKDLFEPLLTKKIAEKIVYVKREDKIVKYEKIDFQNK